MIGKTAVLLSLIAALIIAGGSAAEGAITQLAPIPGVLMVDGEDTCTGSGCSEDVSLRLTSAIFTDPDEWTFGYMGTSGLFTEITSENIIGSPQEVTLPVGLIDFALKNPDPNPEDEILLKLSDSMVNGQAVFSTLLSSGPLLFENLALTFWDEDFPDVELLNVDFFTALNGDAVAPVPIPPSVYLMGAGLSGSTPFFIEWVGLSEKYRFISCCETSLGDTNKIGLVGLARRKRIADGSRV